MRIDFELSDSGTVYLFRPLTRAVQAWVDDHLPPDATWFCGAVVEHCYIGAIVEGAIADGMVVR
jgi:hypothetical protein